MEPQEESCEELDSYSGDESEGGRFPGLNKAHGFFNLIKRNQRDRDTYHQEQEELREARRLAVKKDLRNERDAKRHPPKALYCPPHRRKPDVPTNSRSNGQGKLFNLEVELQPGLWWRGTVQSGEEHKLAEQLMKEHDLSPPVRDALLNMMKEFAAKLS